MAVDLKIDDQDLLLVIDPQWAFNTPIRQSLWKSLEKDLFPRFPCRAYTQFLNSPKGPVWQLKGWHGCGEGSKESRLIWETTSVQNRF